MGDRLQHRRVHLLIPDLAGDHLLLDDSGDLPTFSIVLLDDETTLLAVRRLVLPGLGLDGPMIDCYVDQGGSHDGDGVGIVAALVEIPAPPPGWPVPAGTRWTSVAAAAPGAEPGLAGHLALLLDEYRGQRPVAALRARWSRPGWYDRACRWIEQALADAGRPPATSVVQVRQWGISAVMRVETGAGPCWFKAVCPHFQREAAITAFLGSEMPGDVARVVAFDTREGWLLLDDLGSETLARDPAPHRPAVEHLVAMQRRFLGRTDELTAAGCPRRPLTELPDLLARVLADPVVQPWLAVTPERACRLVAWLVGAVARIDTLGVPDTLVHGDLHPANIAIAGGRPVVFDWSDAAVSHPLVDVVTWASWFPDDIAAINALWAMFFAAWDDVVPITRLETLRPVLEAVTGAYHTVSYARILASLEPDRRAEHADGLTDFFALLDAAVPHADPPDRSAVIAAVDGRGPA